MRPDGSRRVFSNSGKARFDDDGEFLGYRGVGSDITEQVQREEELLRAKEAAEAASLAKSEFLASVSHELRTPITSIKGALGLIQGGVTGSLAPDAEDMVRIAYQNCDRLGILIDDLLDMEKIQAGKMEFSMRPFGVLEMLEDSIEANRGYADGFGVAMQLDHSLGTGVRVVGDKARIIQVMTNLLSNAVKFSPPTAPVRIDAKLNGTRVRISVGDEGPGIPTVFHHRVFEAFSQADSSDTRERGGTGLGLTISKAIVDHHSGEIFFETEDGKGTTFHVELPLA